MRLSPHRSLKSASRAVLCGTSGGRSGHDSVYMAGRARQQLVQPGELVSAGLPQAGDTAVIEAGMVEANGTIPDGVTMQLGVTGSSSHATLAFTGDRTLGSAVQLDVAGLSAELRIAGKLAFEGIIDVETPGGMLSILGAGSLVRAPGAQLNVGAGQSLSMQGRRTRQ